MIDENIQEGDYIIVREKKIARNGDLVIAYVNNDATLKRYYKKENKIELHPANPNYKIIEVNKTDDFRIGGKVLGVMRNYT